MEGRKVFIKLVLRNSPCLIVSASAVKQAAVDALTLNRTNCSWRKGGGGLGGALLGVFSWGGQVPNAYLTVTVSRRSGRFIRRSSSVSETFVRLVVLVRLLSLR